MTFPAILERETPLPVHVESTLTPERRMKLRVTERDTGREVEPTDAEFDRLADIARGDWS